MLINIHCLFLIILFFSCFMFEKKSPHNDVLEQLVGGNILLDISLEQEMSGFENHPTKAKPLMVPQDTKNSIILSQHDNMSHNQEESGDINLEYYDNRKNNIEDEFATFCMLEFNLSHKDEVANFIKNEANLEKSIAHIDKIYSLNERFISKQSHNPKGFKQGVFTDILLSYDMTLEEIAVLFTTMRHFNYHKSKHKNKKAP